MKNLDHETKRDYSNDISTALFDIDNDGIKEKVYRTKLMVRGVKCWGDLYAFRPDNDLLNQGTINIRDFSRKADINVREIGLKRWLTDPEKFMPTNIYRQCITFEPFVFSEKVLVKAGKVVFELAANEKSASIKDVCQNH